MDAKLVVVMTLDKHHPDVVHCLELVRHLDSDAVAAVVEVAAVGGLVLAVQGLKHLCGHDAQVCHLLLLHVYVDAFFLHTVDVAAGYAFYVAYVALGKLCIVRHLYIAQTVSGQTIEHTVNIAEIIPHYRIAGTGGEGMGGILHFAAKHIPFLLYFCVGKGLVELH